MAGPRRRTARDRPRYEDLEEREQAMSDMAASWLRRLLRRPYTQFTHTEAESAPPGTRGAAMETGSLDGKQALLSQAQILEYVNDAAIVVDPDSRILSWNRAAEAIYGWAATEVLGKALDDIIPVIRFLDGSGIDDVMAAYDRDGYWNGEVIQRHRD